MYADTIKFKAQNSILSEYEGKVKVYYEDKDKVDEVLREYVEYFSSTLS